MRYQFFLLHSDTGTYESSDRSAHIVARIIRSEKQPLRAEMFYKSFQSYNFLKIAGIDNTFL